MTTGRKRVNADDLKKIVGLALDRADRIRCQATEGYAVINRVLMNERDREKLRDHLGTILQLARETSEQIDAWKTSERGRQ